MKIIHHATSDFKDEILALYKESFPRSCSDEAALNLYLDAFLVENRAYLTTQMGSLKAALLYSLMDEDKELPSSISENFKLEQTLYIAEMMVGASSRGQGLGTALLEEFFRTIDKSCFTDVFIRVWDQNSIAIGLYLKMGFIPYTEIDQLKENSDGKGHYRMKKIYLHKKL